jgi:MFS-type transporter involved in bile tolerance (Atg22 family)
MFFKSQYNADMADISYLMMFFSLLTIISQLVIVPVLSGRLKFRDTTIIIFAMSTSIIGYLIFALRYDLTFLLLGYVFWAFYANITTTFRSCLTKIVNPSEIGSVLSIFGIFQSLPSIASEPFYGFLYKSTVAVFPATYLFVSISLFSVALVTLIVAHVGLKKREGEMENANEKAVTENKTKSTVHFFIAIFLTRDQLPCLVYPD